MKNLLRINVVFLFCLLAWESSTHSWAAEKPAYDEKAVGDFYKGKTVRIIVGFSAGGGYDAYSRLIARHLQKYIPGSPNIIVENMTGAGSILAANHVYNVAPKDGTVIGNISGPIILEQLFGSPAVQFDMAKFGYLAVPVEETYLFIVTKKPGVAKFDEIVGPKGKQVVVGAIPGSTVEHAPIIVREVLGANVKLVTGYKGTADVRMAIDSGEVGGFFNTWTSSKITSLEKFKSGEWSILAQLGDEPIRDLPFANIPAIPQLGKTEEQRQLLRFGTSIPNQFGKVYVLAAGVPQDRTAALENAFVKAFADKELLSEADKGRLEIAPVSAQRTQKLVTEFLGMSPDIKGKLQKLIRPSK
jgi:tripartite-type tricarboxylate transporter receptor subunit TctC